MQIYAAQPITFSANESFDAISADRELLFTFLYKPTGMARKLDFNPLIFYTELKRYSVFHQNLSDVLCTVSTYVIYVS